MPILSVIWWRDIPAQVVAKEGRRTSKIVLHPRFQVAIDKAANRAGLRAYNDYIDEWRKTQRPCGEDVEAEVQAEIRPPRGRVHQAHPGRADPVRRPCRWAGAAARHHFGDLTDMTETVLSSATREVVLGFDRPFVIIGERINPTGRKLLAEEMKAGDFSRVERDVIAQVEAGAHMLDVNAGIPLADEPAILAHTIRLVQSLTDLPLSIDSSIVEALEAGLAAYVGKPLVNSVTGEEERLERILPLIKKYGAAVVAISNDDTGHQRGSGRPVRGRQADRRAGRGPRHPRQRHHRGPAGHAHRRHGDGRPPGVLARRSPAQRAEGQLDLRRVERQLRPAEPRGHQRRVPADGDRVRHDLGHHQPDAAGPQARGHGRRRPDGQRPRLRPLDHGQPRRRCPRARSAGVA